MDRPDEADESPDSQADRQDDQTDGGTRPARANRTPAETRDREEYYVALRIADSTQQTVTARRVAAEEQVAYEKWAKDSEESRWMWGEYQRRWPPGEHSKVNRPDDEE